MEETTDEPPLIGLVGPTAVGKTAVGIILAQLLNGEIVSADAVAVYKGLDIGSAKPDAAEKQQATFHLIDVITPDEDFTLADFTRLANATIADIRQRGKTPILVGGTGLYVRSVTATLSVPNVPPQPERRERLWAEVERHGASYLHTQLKKIDPISAKKILPGDAKRIIRAIEVYEVTGQPMSAYHTPEGVQGIPRPNTYLIGLTMEREHLYARIEARVDAMMATGFEAEVRRLLEIGYSPESKALQSLGYRHMCDFIFGKNTIEEAIITLKRDTRRFAKRQLSWFGADKQVTWLNRENLVLTHAYSMQPTDVLRSEEQEAPTAETVAHVIVRFLEQTAATKQNK
jgi:tRNA dimethylallyltransferase